MTLETCKVKESRYKDHILIPFMQNVQNRQIYRQEVEWLPRAGLGLVTGDGYRVFIGVMKMF